MNGEEDQVLDPQLATLWMAKCKVTELDQQYGDKVLLDELCSDACMTCQQCPPPPTPVHCKCSGCMPETVADAAVQPTKPRSKPVPVKVRITKEMWEVAVKKLEEFRDELWSQADNVKTVMLPPVAFLTDSSINKIVDQMHLVLNKEHLAAFIASESEHELTARDTFCVLIELFTEGNPFIKLLL